MFFIKGGFDKMFSFFLILLLLPLILIIAAIIRLDSKGPVFYRQERIGKNGIPFFIWKFRTMTVHADQTGPLLTKENDSRITRFGRFLRRFSLDELPQLYNVFLGEMSIVGPRPEIPELVATYSEGQKQVLIVNPGITGLSQINGRDDLPLAVKLDYDLTYIKTFSPWLDLKILIKTVPAILSGKGDRW